MSLKTIKDVTNYLDLKEKNVKYDSDGSVGGIVQIVLVKINDILHFFLR